MKTIGLIGGMSWESTAEYYRLINQGVNKKLGGLHSAKLLIHSVDFGEIEPLQMQDQWDDLAEILAKSARSLEWAGADFIVLATNTMHVVANAIEDAIAIPFLHIADATASAIKTAGISNVGLLGTRFTMNLPFYKNHLADKYGLKVVTPGKADQATVHDIIYTELVKGVVTGPSRHDYLSVVNRLQSNGAEGIILGCTEIGLLIKNGDHVLPFFDTTEIHAHAAVEFALAH